MNSTTPEASANETVLENFLLSSVNIWVYSINFLFGLPTHSYIIWLIVTGTGSGVASEFFNINLSVCELSFSFNCLLGVLSNFVKLLELSTFLIGVTVTGRPLFQSLICVERYLAVVHPVTFLKSKPLRYRVICCIAAWILTLGSCLFLVFTSDFSNLVYFMWLFPIQFLLFLFIQLFCCLAVLRALKQSGPGERGREKREEERMKKRAFYLILISTVTMFIMFVPYILTSLFAIITQQNNQTCYTLSLVCFILGGFVHPLLFLHRTGKIMCICSS